MLRRHSKYAGLALVAGLFLASGEFGVSVAGAGPARSPAAPGDLLSDGYDALGADRLDLARKIFQTLLNAYPQSTEAATAADELAALNGGDDPSDGPVAEPPSSRSAPGKAMALSATRPPFAGKTEAQLHSIGLRFLQEAGDRVFFAENSATLGGRARAIIDAQARWLKKSEGFQITVIGRAADGGSAADNKALSLARAKSVEARLIEAGIDPKRIAVEGRGNADPIAICKESLCDAQNRHAESLLRYGRESSPKISSIHEDPVLDREPARDSSKSAAR